MYDNFIAILLWLFFLSPIVNYLVIWNGEIVSHKKWILNVVISIGYYLYVYFFWMFTILQDFLDFNHGLVFDLLIILISGVVFSLTYGVIINFFLKKIIIFYKRFWIYFLTFLPAVLIFFMILLSRISLNK